MYIYEGVRVGRIYLYYYDKKFITRDAMQSYLPSVNIDGCRCIYMHVCAYMRLCMVPVPASVPICDCVWVWVPVYVPMPASVPICVCVCVCVLVLVLVLMPASVPICVCVWIIRNIG